MADKISEIGGRILSFFQRKKTEYVFQNAGPGYTLNESPSTSNANLKNSAEELDARRKEPSEETKQAAEAALTRCSSGSARNVKLKTQVRKENVLDQKKTEDRTGMSSHINLKQDELTESLIDPTSCKVKQKAAEAALARFSSNQKNGLVNKPLTSAKAHIRRELLRINQQIENDVQSSEDEDVTRHLAVNGVYFKCPLVSDEILTKDEWQPKIKDFLYTALGEEGGIAACLILFSCNYHNVAKIQECVKIISKYIDNIIANPSDPKYHKIRCSNKTFLEKVASMVGAKEFLQAAGFRSQKLEHNGNMEEFLVWEMENIESIEILQILKDDLKSGIRVELELDRNIQVLKSDQAERRVDLPRDFYGITTNVTNRSGMEFALIRVKFPDGLHLQVIDIIRSYKNVFISIIHNNYHNIDVTTGIKLEKGVFSEKEKLLDVIDFVRENLDLELPFVLSSTIGFQYEEMDFGRTLSDLGLVPFSILMFSWDPIILEELIETNYQSFLKPETLTLMQES